MIIVVHKNCFIHKKHTNNCYTAVNAWKEYMYVPFDDFFAAMNDF